MTIVYVSRLFIVPEPTTSARMKCELLPSMDFKWLLFKPMMTRNIMLQCKFSCMHVRIFWNFERSKKMSMHVKSVIFSELNSFSWSPYLGITYYTICALNVNPLIDCLSTREVFESLYWSTKLKYVYQLNSTLNKIQTLWYVWSINYARNFRPNYFCRKFNLLSVYI